jgi:hypothetical protein
VTTQDLPDQWGAVAAEIAHLWPMPMNRLDLTWTGSGIADIQDERNRRWDALMATEPGLDRT